MIRTNVLLVKGWSRSVFQLVSRQEARADMDVKDGGDGVDIKLVGGT